MSPSPPHRGLPSKADIVKFIEETPGDVGKREIARAFGIKGADRIELKKLLKEMEADGLFVRRRRNKVTQRGHLPNVTVLTVFGESDEGDLLARPVKWDVEDDGPAPVVLVKPTSPKGHVPPGIDTHFLARCRATPEADYPYECHVMRLLDQRTETILGVFDTHGPAGRVEPVDRKVRFAVEIAKADQAGAQPRELVEVELLPHRKLGLRWGKIVKRIANADDARTISLIAIHEHGIPDRFPDPVLAEAKAAKPVASPKGRTDLTHLPLLTIDPADARDHDDAVCAQPDDDPGNEGGFVLHVAIADVAHYVTPGSELDKEARKRGNSTYFPDRVVPMLPEELSADLCSLHEDEVRPCLAVRMVIDRHGKKIRHKFVRGLMKSRASLTYGDAQTAFDGAANDRAAPFADDILIPLYKAWQCLKQARDKREPLDLDLPEHQIALGEDGHVASVRLRERFDAHRLIEDFMILANVAAAETLEQSHLPCLYRIHEAPAEEKLKVLGDYLSTLGLRLAKGQNLRPNHFNHLIAQARGTPHADVVQETVLRSQMQAIYTSDNMGHFGLNLRRYAHFTSPIRRYADLYVHRALIRAGKLGEDGASDEEITRLTETAEHISRTERRSMMAERSTVDRYMAHYMDDRIGVEFAGRISGVNKAGLFVRVDGIGADGLVPMRRLGGDYFIHDESKFALIGRETGLAYSLGDPVEVRLAETAPLKGGLLFDLIDHTPQVKHARPSPRARHGRPARPARKAGKAPRGKKKRR